MNIVIKKIQEKMGSFTKTQLKIASYIMLSGPAVTYDPLDTTAEIIGVSRPSVIQFAKELGYSGYAEMQKQLRSDIQADASGIIYDENQYDGLMKYSFNRVIQNIRKTMRYIVPKDIETAVKFLSEANNIIAIGLRESFALAHYFYTRVVAMRKNVYLANFVDSGIYESFFSYGKEDVCVFFLFHEYTPIAFDLLPMLKSRGLKVIIVTNPPAEAILPYADICISCCVDGFYVRNSTASVMSVVDYLTNCLIAKDYTSYLNYYSDASEFGGTFQSLRNYRKENSDKEK